MSNLLQIKTLQYSTTKKIKIIVYLFLFCFVLIGVPLFWMDSNLINPDSFYYISIANYYLFAPLVNIRDAFTVGPVIPAFLAIAKFVLLHFAIWHPGIDLLLLKISVFFCYLIIAFSAYNIINKYISVQNTCLVVFLLFFFPRIDFDVLSLNGELVSVTIISILMVLLQHKKKNLFLSIFAAILSVLVIYTKIQAIPILILLLLSEMFNQKEAKRFFACFIAVLVIAELFLYTHGIGLLKNMTNMYYYVFPQNSSAAVQYDVVNTICVLAKKYFTHFGWVTAELPVYFPILFFVLFVLLFNNSKLLAKNIFSDWRTWICVTYFSIAFPGKPFTHYLILTIPFIVKFSGQAIANIKIIDFNLKKEYFLFSFLFFLSLTRIFSSFPVLTQLRGVSLVDVLPKLNLGGEVDNVRNIIRGAPGTVYVNGWDYRIHTYLNIYGMVNDTFVLQLGVISERTYVDSLLMNKFDYLIDVVGFSGLISDPKYSLSSPGMLGATVSCYYDRIYTEKGLSLYRKKPDAKFPFPAIGCFFKG